MNRHVRTALIALFGALVLSTAAHANDYKVFSGSTCKRYNFWQYENYGGAVRNSSDIYDLEVVCPFVRDNSYLSSATIQVWDQNPDWDVHCDFRYEFASGPWVYSASNSVQTSGADSNPQNLYVGQLSGGSYYYAFCSIPRRVGGSNIESGIINFWLYEPRND